MKFFIGLFFVSSFSLSVFAESTDCRIQVRDLRKEIVASERNTAEIISYLSSTGEYLVKSGRSIKAVINSGGRLAPSVGDTLVYSGQQVLESASNASSSNLNQIDRLSRKLDLLEDCMLSL